MTAPDVAALPLLLMGRPWDGYGDAIQASRYLSEVNRAFGPFTLVVAPNLVRLFGGQGLPVVAYEDRSGSLTGGTNSITERIEQRNHRTDVFVLTVDALYRPTVHRGVLTRVGTGTVWTSSPEPQRPATLWADPTIRHSYRVGLCCTGRGIPIAAVRPLLEVPLSWLALHYAGDPYCSDDDRSALDLPTLDQLGVRDWADTAGVLTQLDLVITADTGLAHLAGTLGIPTWLLLGPHPCLRWGRGETTPLYPSMRIFRHSPSNDNQEWAPIIDAVGAELRERTGPAKETA